MAGKIVRSQNSDFTQIYRTFFAKDLHSENLVEFTIEDLTDDYADKAADLLVNCLAFDEVFNKSLKISENPQALKVLKEFYMYVVREKFSLACFKTESRELVGVNALVVKSKGDEKIQVRKKVKKIATFIKLESFRLKIQK